MKKIVGRSYIFIILFYVIIMFLLNDAGRVIDFLTFDINSPDLQHAAISPIEIRNRCYGSAYYYGMLVGEIVNKNVLFIPLILSVTAILYGNYKNRYLKYEIGKGNNYNKLLKRSKISISLANCILISSVFIIYMLVSYIITGWDHDKGTAFVNFADVRIKNEAILVFLVFLETNLITFTLGYLILTAVDRTKSTIKVSIISLILIYLMDGLVGTLISPNFSLLASMGWINSVDANISVLLVSYVYIGIIYFVIKRFSTKEI